MIRIKDIFIFDKKKELPDAFFQEACDVHCHILPGVDDGFQSEDDSIEALRYCEGKGMRKVCLTPHFMKDYSENTKETITSKFEEFKKKAEASCGIELHLGGEYMLDAKFPEHLKNGFLTIDREKSLVLCETSYLMCAPNASYMLYDVMLGGYTPVIAHPERYRYASKIQYDNWKNNGYLFQLNLLSLSGAYGELAMEKSHGMLKLGMYDFIGSDMHRLDSYRIPLSKMKLSTKEIDALHLLYENNAKIF